jgi:hypothetical protein
MTACLLGLPVEVSLAYFPEIQANVSAKLLYRVFLLSSSPVLPLVCRSLWTVFRQAPSSIMARYLPHDLQSALNYPIMDENVLEQYLRLRPPDQYAYDVKLPLRLFKKLPKPRTKDLRAQLPDHYKENSEPIPFLRALLRLYSDRVDVNFPNEYPLRSAVRAGHVPLIKLLLGAGANPCGGEYDSLPEWPLVMAVKIRSLTLVRLMLEEGKRQREERSDFPTELLTEAYERKAYDIVFYLTEEKGMLPTVEILQWIADQGEPVPSRKRRRVDSSNRSGPSH